MAIKHLNPYFFFHGNAADVIRFYESALGAKVETQMRYGDLKDMPMPESHKNRIMHAKLLIGGGTIMISDARPGEPEMVGNNVQVLLDFDDVAEMGRRFEALSAGAKEIEAPQDTFWGAKFGSLTDRFGIRWMFNCETKKV